MGQATETPSLLQDPKRLRVRRVLAGFNQKQAASRANLARSHMCRLEQGTRGASEETLHTLAQLYGCSVADLMSTEARALLGLDESGRDHS